MHGMILGYVIALLLLLAVSGLCSCSETVFFSQNPLQVRRFTQKYPRMGERLHRLLSEPKRLLSTILILNTIVNTVFAILAFKLIDRYLAWHAEPVSTALATLVLLIFGEYGPKRIGLMFTETLTCLLTPMMKVMMPLTSPIHWFLRKLTRAFEPLFRVRSQALSEEEIHTLFEVSGADGIMDAEEYSMVKAIIGLEDLTAASIMTPRVDVVGLDLDSDPATWVDRVRGARKKHLLLYRGQMDEVEGVLNVREYLLDPEHRVGAATRPAMFVPATVPLSRLLAVFRKDRQDIAVVVDEYGGTFGVVTVGDVLERVSGAVYEELAKPRPVLQEVGPGRWLVDARFDVAGLNRKLGLNLVPAGGTMLSNWLAHHMGRVPRPDESVEAEGVRVTAIKTDRAIVTLAQIQRLEETP